MKFLVDENISLKVVVFLRNRHCNTLSVLESGKLRGSSDDFLIGLANKEKRVIITLDKDFGELVFGRLKRTAGIILLRLDNEREDNIVRILSELFKLKINFNGKFITVSENKIRIRLIKNNRNSFESEIVRKV